MSAYKIDGEDITTTQLMELAELIMTESEAVAIILAHGRNIERNRDANATEEKA